MSRLERIDAAIVRSGLLGRKCFPAHKRTRCQCGHVDATHRYGDRSGHPKDWTRGECHARGCGCLAFVPYDYAKETQAKLKKLRMLALDILENCCE